MGVRASGGGIRGDRGALTGGGARGARSLDRAPSVPLFPVFPVFPVSRLQRSVWSPRFRVVHRRGAVSEPGGSVGSCPSPAACSKPSSSGSRTPTRRTATRSPGSTPAAGGDLLTVVGALLGAQPGESLRMEGRWASHPQYGKQFTVENYTTVLPATIQGIRRYLGSGLIKGIGPVIADRIVEHFGVDTLDIIEQEPQAARRGPGPRSQADQDDRAPPGRSRRPSRKSWSSSRASASPPPSPCGSTRSTATPRSRSSRTSRTGWPPTSGASASSPPTGSPRPSASRTTARSGSRPASSTPFPSPPTRATASCPRSG